MTTDQSPMNSPHSLADRSFSRRQALHAGLAGAAGLFLANGLNLPTVRAAASAPAPAPLKGKAKSVIQVWLWGGPCHIDTFDPKPEAGYDYCGSLGKTIDTNVPGIRLNESLPLLAKHADKYSLIRSMTHGVFGHETAAYMVQTGRPAGDNTVYPSIGAVVSCFKGYSAGYKGLIPPYIVMTQLQGRFSEVGFLPSACKPFATGGDPNRTPFVVEGVVATGVSEDRQKSRRELLGQLNTLGHVLKDDSNIIAIHEDQQQAYDLILGDGGKVFDLTQEKDATRDSFGRTTFGQACLMARRLVERGVPYVTINFQGWDTHKQHFQAMRRLLPDLDKALSMLLQDLSDHGLLDSTIVFCCGEFGRTPKVMWEPPWDGGRGHWGNVFSALVAGGGFKGGHVVGSSDAKGEKVKDRPVYPADLLGSIYQMLGIDLEARLPHPQNRDVRVVPAASSTVKLGGLLKEIM